MKTDSGSGWGKPVLHLGIHDVLAPQLRPLELCFSLARSGVIETVFRTLKWDGLYVTSGNEKQYAFHVCVNVIQLYV